MTHTHTPIKKISDIKPGDHLCCIYSTEDEHRIVITQYLRAGLEHNEKVFYIVDARTKDVVINYLKNDGIDVKNYLKTGQFAILTIADAYMKGGVFDPDKMIVLLTSETQKALDEGYSALRVTGEMSWALRGLPGSERLIEYENKLNTFFPGSKCLAICQYDRRSFDAEILLNILLTHPFAFIGANLYDNFYYAPPEDILQPNQSEMTLDRWIANIKDRKEAEQALQEREEKFRLLFSRMPSGVAIYEAVDNGEDFIFRDFNAEGEVIEHVRKEDVIGKRVTEVFPGVKEFGAFSVFQRVWRTGNPEFFPTAVYRDARDPGTWRESWIYKLPTGEIVSIYNDVTERKRVEENLRSHEAELTMQNEELRTIQQDLQVSRDQYMDLYDMAPAGYLTISRDGLIVKANLTSSTLLNVERRKLVNAPLSRFIAPDDQNMYYLHRKQLLDANQQQSFELRIRRQGGRSPIWVHIIMELAQAGEADEAACNLIILDITERKRAEVALVESEERFRLTFELATIGKSLTAIDGKLIKVNRAFCEMLGYTVQELQEKGFAEVTHPDDVAKSQESVRTLLAGEHPMYRFEKRYIRKDGAIVWADVSTMLLRDPAGKPLTFVTHIMDITDRKRAEQEIARIAHDWEITFNATTDGICLIDANQNLQRCNDRMGEILGGLKPEDLAGKPCWVVVHKTTGPIPECPFVLAKTTLKRTQVEIPAGDHWFEVTADPVLDNSGSFAGAVHIMRDITERKRVEEALQKSELRYRNLFNSSHDAMMTLEPPSWRFTSCNPSAVQMFLARAEAEFTSKEPWTLSPAQQPDGRGSPEKAKDMIETALQNGTQFFEWTHTRLNGENFPATVLLSKTELAGKVFLQATVRDITEQKRAEAALVQLSADHKAIIDHAPAMIWYKDTKNTFVRVNPSGARAFGMAIDEIEGKSAYDLFPDFAEKYYQDDREVINSGIPKLGIIEPMITASGEHLWVMSDKIPLKNDQWDITGLLVFSVDITERKRVEEALQQVNKQLNLLSSITRHDILNQLMALKGYLELSSAVIDKPETLREFIKKEQKAADTIEHQITFTKDYQELGVAAPSWQNVNASIKKAVARLPMRDIHVAIDPKAPEIFADPLFEKVFYNLIDNALRYGSDRLKAIRVSSQESDAHLTIICEDDGVGITADDKKRLFTRGFGKNTGLGLFLSREILAITGITITENGIPGKGARFEITVPEGKWRTAGNGA